MQKQWGTDLLVSHISELSNFSPSIWYIISVHFRINWIQKALAERKIFSKISKNFPKIWLYYCFYYLCYICSASVTPMLRTCFAIPFCNNRKIFYLPYASASRRTRLYLSTSTNFVFSYLLYIIRKKNIRDCLAFPVLFIGYENVWLSVFNVPFHAMWNISSIFFCCSCLS